MKTYSLVTLSSEQLKEIKLLIQCDKRGRLAKFDVHSTDLINELQEDIKTLRNEGYTDFNIIFIPSCLIFCKQDYNPYKLFTNLGLGNPILEQSFPELKGTKFIVYNAEDQDIKIEL